MPISDLHAKAAAARAQTKAVLAAPRPAALDMASDLVHHRARYSSSKCSDSIFFLRNEHSILSLVFVHGDHPFDRKERFVALVVTLSWSLLFSLIIETMALDSELAEIFVTLALISLPVMLCNTVLQMIFTLDYRLSKLGERGGCIASCCRYAHAVFCPP
jgi:hypothetical protein